MSVLNKNLHVVRGLNYGVIIEKLETHHEIRRFASILNNTEFLQGYYAHDPTCLQVKELKNYHIHPAIVASFAMSSGYSICGRINEIQKGQKIHITHVLGLITINQGFECLVQGYQKLDFLGGNQMSLFDNGRNDGARDLYCLYGSKEQMMGEIPSSDAGSEL